MILALSLRFHFAADIDIIIIDIFHILRHYCRQPGCHSRHAIIADASRISSAITPPDTPLN
jgi:hypothetical protein